MSARKKEKFAVAEANAADSQTPGANLAKGFIQNIFALANRGLLLDIFVFLLNLLLMRQLTRFFTDISHQAADGDSLAEFILLLFFIAIFLLPPLVTIFKRWHFHQRHQNENLNSVLDRSYAAGCLLNPVLFFILNILIYIGIMVLFEFEVYGDQKINNTLAGSLAAFGVVLVAFQTFVVYRYFSPPKNPPKSEFLRGARSEFVGDVAIFLYMILFQVIWNFITSLSYSTRRVSGVEDFIGRVVLWTVVALIVYFPPRIFYLAEDINKRRVWLTMLLANAPVIFRVLIGRNPADW